MTMHTAHSGRPLAALLLLLLLLAVAGTSQAADSSTSISSRYAVIIDAGSTGSRAHVFRYHHDAASAAAAAAAPAGPYPSVELPEALHKTSPGLSAFASDPRAAANSLQPLIKFAKAKVPAGQWASTPIQLMATAGLRLLNNGSADRILAEVDKVLSASGFAYSSTQQQHQHAAASGASAVSGARVLSGAEEGLLGWVALNYASGALQAASAQQQDHNHHQRQGRKDTPPVAPAAAPPLRGVLELGGGSLQVTFLPPPSSPNTPTPALPPAEAAPLALPAPLGPGRLYSRSFDGLGLQAAMSQWAAALAKTKAKHDPCTHAGYTPTAASATSAAATVHHISGSGDWKACKAGVLQLLPKKPCRHKTCGLAGTFLPAIEGTTFVGLDNFFYTASLLALPTSSPSSLEDIDRAAAAFCGKPWSHIASHYLKGHKGDELRQAFHTRVCFSAALILGVLREGLHLPPTKQLLTASNSISTPQGHSYEAKWPLGALVVSLLNSSSSGSSGSSKQQHQQQHQQQQQQASHQHKPAVTTQTQTQTAGVSDSGSSGEAAEGDDRGLSAGSAAALAAAFCLSLIALMLCASWLGVGMLTSSSSNSSLPGSSSSSRAGWWWWWLQRMQRQLFMAVTAVAGGSRAGTASGGGSSGSIGGGGGSSSSVRYMRVSRTEGPRPRSTSPTRKLAVGGVGVGDIGGSAAAGVGSVMLAVLPSESAAAGVVITGSSTSSSANGAVSVRPLTARQR